MTASFQRCSTQWPPGPGWSRTALIVTYDEWGGFYDHVVPPRVTATSAPDKDLENGKARLGFRVPTIVASPFTKGDPRSPRVNHNLFDHTSILKFIESNFGLRPLGPRDGSRLRSDPGDLGTTLRRGLGDPTVPRDIPTMPAPPVVTPCGPLNPSPVATSDDTWSGLVASGLLQGWR